MSITTPATSTNTELSESNVEDNYYKLHGGDFTSFTSSKPAEYNNAFNGQPSFFKYPDDMMARTFDGKQPVWKPTDL